MKAVATIETLWGTKHYSRRILPRLETYDIDSAMDTDADQFSLTLGDPFAELTAIFRRDGEIRAQVSGTYNNGRTFVPLLSGFVDVADTTHDGELTLTGRDMSSAAIDDTAIPWSWAIARPGQIIIKQARARGFTRFGGLLVHPNSIKALASPLYTDGSESVWALWYRMIRDKQMWIWTTAAGTLMVDTLNYASKPKYLFGSPNTRLWPQYSNAKNWIPVMESEMQKNTQTRIHEVWVYSDNGNQSFPPVKASDSTMDGWIKKPLTILPTQANVHNPSQAMKQAQEELFEGKVGELEIIIRITDPGYIVQQNEIAALNIPSRNLSGEFFVVGVHLMGGTTGAIQEIRLREKKYALTKRIPLPPGTSTELQSTNFGNVGMGAKLGINSEVGAYFVEAAKMYHGQWDFALFLATLLAIGQRESNFKNVREPSGGPDWYPKPGSPSAQTRLHARPPGSNASVDNANSVLQWERAFANAKDDKLNPFYPSREAGVGYMQLTDLSAKQHADSITGVHDEFSGGRWDARANILTGAWVLAAKLNEMRLPVTDADFWIGVQGYNGYPNGKLEQGAYSQAIEKDVNASWLKQVEQAAIGTSSSDPTSTQYKYSSKLPEAVKKIIHYAEAQVGKGYSMRNRFGPTTFDCSGLSYMAYRAAGFTPADFGENWDTWGFWGNNSPSGNHKNHDNLVFVPVDDLSPGDMVFFDIPSNGGNPPQHMGIYYHDGLMIAAENPSLGVRITSIHGEPGSIMGGMRVKGIYSSVSSPNNPRTHS